MPQALEIRVLGELEVVRDGKPAALPHSRKTRALLAYLAVQRAPQRRDALCELLWELPDDPRAALRWSLTKLRPLLNDPDCDRLEADRERVTFAPRNTKVDLTGVREACADGPGRLSVSELRGLAGSFRGPFLAGLDLPGQPAFETWRLGQQEQTRRLHLRILDALAAKLDEAPDEVASILRRRIELDPGDETAHVRLVAMLAQNGAAGEAEQQRQASGRMLGAIGPYDEKALDQALRQARAPARSPPQTAEPDEPLKQQIRFCTSGDGVRIAYATVGAGPPLVKTANWLNHLEFDWESPIWKHFFRAFAKQHTLIRYDSRGNGLSDWNAAFSLDAFVNDLKAVADAAGVERFPLLALSQGCPIAVEFAVRYPERVSKLVLYGGYARGWRLSEDQAFREQQEAMITLTRTGWGKDNPAYRQMFTSFFIPDAPRAQMDWCNELQRRTTSPENAANLQSALGDLDVRPRLASVRVPTLVMHVRNDARVSFDRGRELAMGIPGARFVPIEGQNHLFLEHDPAFGRFLAETREFLAE